MYVPRKVWPRGCGAIAAILLSGCTGLIAPQEERRRADPLSTRAEQYDAAVRSTAPPRATRISRPASATTAPAATTRPDGPELRADGDVGPTGLMPRPLRLAEPVWSSGPAGPTATIAYYIRSEQTAAGYVAGSYLREGNYIRGEWTPQEYVRGNYRGESADYIRGEWTPQGYRPPNDRSEPMFAQPATLRPLPPSGSQVPAYRP